MLQSYQAVIEQGQLKWLDTPPAIQNAKIIVTLLPDELAFNDVKSDDKPRKIGMSAGKAKFPDDINKYDDEVARLFGVEL